VSAHGRQDDGSWFRTDSRALSTCGALGRGEAGAGLVGAGTGALGGQSRRVGPRSGGLRRADLLLSRERSYRVILRLRGAPEPAPL